MWKRLENEAAVWKRSSYSRASYDETVRVLFVISGAHV